jgi:inner membrane protein involved in colicin E2 resistance
MDLVIEPDIYAPSIDDNGNYIDKIPSFNIIKKGLYCPCGARKDKIYDTHTVFSGHIKSKTHQKWLDNLNLNKANYYIENEKLNEILQNQKLIIAKLEKDIHNKSMTIDYLTQQLTKANTLNSNSIINNNNNKTVTNLLDFDFD